MKHILVALALAAAAALGTAVIAASPAQACTILPANPRHCI